MHLIGLEHEVLAKCRQRAGGAGDREKLRCTLKTRRIGEDGKTCSAAGLIGRSERGRIEIRANQTLGRACLLDLGDETESAGVLFGLEGARKAAWRFLIGRARLQLGERNCNLGCAISSRL